LKTLKTFLLSNRDICLPNSKQMSSSNKRKPISNTKQQEGIVSSANGRMQFKFLFRGKLKF
jgi:hypothetical protein